MKDALELVGMVIFSVFVLTVFFGACYCTAMALASVTYP